MIRRQNDIAYGPDAAHKLDFYQAANPGAHVLVVYIHGGGWQAGNKRNGRMVGPTLARSGYNVASLGYRLVPQADLHGGLQDLAAAIAFLLNNAEQFAILSGGFALMGHSAGGHMAAMLATDQSYLTTAGVDPDRLRAVITLDGVFDMAWDKDAFPNASHPDVFGADANFWRRFSPTEQLSGMRAHPTFCIIHEDTKPRFANHAIRFATALRERGETVDQITVPGLNHGQIVSQFAEHPTMAEATLKCLAQTMQRLPADAKRQ